VQEQGDVAHVAGKLGINDKHHWKFTGLACIKRLLFETKTL
jgi:hypothetical protein